jgi:nucleolar protein 56
VRISYDWRLSRLINDEGVVIDEIYWTSDVTVSNLVRRLLLLQKGRMSPEARILYERFDDVEVFSEGHLNDINWPPYDENEQKMFDEAIIKMTKLKIAESSGDLDKRLDMLVSSVNEIRSTWTTSESRCIEWTGLFLTEINLDTRRKEIIQSIVKSDSISSAANLLETTQPLFFPSEVEWESLKKHCESVVDLTERMKQHEDAIRILALDYVPTLSSLIGPLSASKLLVLAGSRERLARMPSGSLQVLGAHAAMAAHRKGASPPKHGSILFSLPQVGKSPRWVRGKVARFIAGKASIATRVDHFGGTPWGDKEITKINDDIEKIISKFPKPPKRK